MLTSMQKESLLVRCRAFHRSLAEYNFCRTPDRTNSLVCWAGMLMEAQIEFDFEIVPYDYLKEILIDLGAEYWITHPAQSQNAAQSSPVAIAAE